MSHSINSLKRGHIGDCIGGIKGDTRSLDYSSYRDDHNDPFLHSLFSRGKMPGSLR